ncbi:Chaperone surA [Gossypium australe]|uniref:Chaperone surA n=1 Tax=Gossypium australe TaxID=47621 RepID=A0A5B6VP97_9ROSI|nr:Chaperone surA [Gossypium australe]
MDPDRAVADEIESNVLAPAQGAAPSESRPPTVSQGEGAREAFLHMMNEVCSNKSECSTSSPPYPQPIPIAPRGVELVRLNKPPVDKIRKQGAEEFRANVGNDPERAEFWLENTIRVFDELSCTPEECLKYAISLLWDTTYHSWKTLVSMVLRERKRKEFLELKQGRMSVTEYEREFVRLSKYA